MGGWTYDEFRNTPARIISYILVKMQAESATKNPNSKKNGT